MPQTNFDTPVDFLSQIGLKYAPSPPYNFEELSKRTFHDEDDQDLQYRVLDRRDEILQANHSKFYPTEFIEEMKKRGLSYVLELGPIFRLCGFDLENFSSRVPNRRLKVLQLGSGPIEYNEWTTHEEGPKLDEILRIYGAEVTNFDILDAAAYYPNSEFIQGDWFELESLIGDREFDIMFTTYMNPSIIEKKDTKLEGRIKLLKSTLSSLRKNNRIGPKLFYTSGYNEMDFDFGDVDEPLREIATNREGFEYLNLQTEIGSRTDLFITHQ